MSPAEIWTLIWLGVLGALAFVLLVGFLAELVARPVRAILWRRKQRRFWQHIEQNHRWSEDFWRSR